MTSSVYCREKTPADGWYLAAYTGAEGSGQVPGDSQPENRGRIGC